MIEEQPNLTGPGSFTSSSRPLLRLWLQPEQVMGTRPKRAAALPCRVAEGTFTQAQQDGWGQEALAVTPQRGTLLPSPTASTPGQRAGPNTSQILGAIIAQVSSLQEWKLSNAR